MSCPCAKRVGIFLFDGHACEYTSMAPKNRGAYGLSRGGLIQFFHVPPLRLFDAFGLGPLAGRVDYPVPLRDHAFSSQPLVGRRCGSGVVCEFWAIPADPG